MSNNLVVQGGNKAIFCDLTTNDYTSAIADALGAPEFTYDNIINVSKAQRPELQDWEIAIQQANLGEDHNTFLSNSLVKVAQTEAIEVTFNDNTVISIAEAPSNANTGIIASVGGIVGGTKRRVQVAYAYLQNSEESDDVANTNVTTTDTYKPVATPCQLTITTGSFNALFSDKCTISSPIVLPTGSYGKIILANA